MTGQTPQTPDAGSGLPPLPQVQSATPQAQGTPAAASSPPLDPTTGQPSPGGSDPAGQTPPPAAGTEPSPDEAEAARRGAQARIDALTSEKWAERRRAAELEQQLAEAQARLQQLEEPLQPQAGADPLAPPGERTYTAAEVQAQARALAQAEARQMAFNNEVNAAIAAGQAAHEDFDSSITSLRRFGPLPPYFVAAVLEAGAGSDVKAHEILYSLGKDLTETDRLLSLPPERVGAAVTRYALTRVQRQEPSAQTQASAAGGAALAAASAALSAAPPPVRSALSPASTAQPRIDDPNLPISEWMKLRDAQVANRGAR